MLKWRCLSQPSGFQTILLKAWLRGTRVSFHERHADVRRQAGSRFESRCHAPHLRRRSYRARSARLVRATLSLRPLSKHLRAYFVLYRIVPVNQPCERHAMIEANQQGASTMDRYAINERTISEAVKGGGLLVVAQWEPGKDRPTGSPISCLASCRRRKANPAQSC